MKTVALITILLCAMATSLFADRSWSSLSEINSLEIKGYNNNGTVLPQIFIVLSTVEKCVFHCNSGDFYKVMSAELLAAFHNNQKVQVWRYTGQYIQNWQGVNYEEFDVFRTEK